MAATDRLLGCGFLGQIANPGSDEWTTVVTDPDRQYVVHCLRWQGYALLRTRVIAATDHASLTAAEVWATRRPHTWDEPDDNGERGHSLDCWCRSDDASLCDSCEQTVLNVKQYGEGRNRQMLCPNCVCDDASSQTAGGAR